MAISKMVQNIINVSNMYLRGRGTYQHNNMAEPCGYDAFMCGGLSELTSMVEDGQQAELVIDMIPSPLAKANSGRFPQTLIKFSLTEMSLCNKKHLTVHLRETLHPMVPFLTFAPDMLADEIKAFMAEDDLGVTVVLLELKAISSHQGHDQTLFVTMETVKKDYTGENI